MFVLAKKPSARQWDPDEIGLAKITMKQAGPE